MVILEGMGTKPQKEPYRLKNRWNLIYLRPFITRWLALSLCFLVLLVPAKIIGGFVGYVLFFFAWGGFISALFVTTLMYWLYSYRPK